MSANSIHQLLIERKQTLCLAESLTGGALAYRFVQLPDSSRYFLGSIVAYSNASKSSILAVKAASLASQGSVSELVALEMAQGAKKVFNADFAIAVTGIAGPSGGRVGKEVGTVCLCLLTPEGERAWTEHFSGDRLQVIESTINAAVSALLQNLLLTA